MIIVLLAFLVPLMATSLWLNFRGMSFTKHAIMDFSSAGASFYSKQLDKEMYFIRNLQLELLGDTDLQKLGFWGSKLAGSYEEVELIGQVRKRLTTLSNSSRSSSNHTASRWPKTGRSLSTEAAAVQLTAEH